jgi:nicotinate-nucleotide pyrophosphorylase (carboxylating)
MNSVTLKLQAEPLILSALREDITSEDVTTASVIGEAATGEVRLIAKEDGVICGLDVFARTFALLDPTATCEFSVEEGDGVTAGQDLGCVRAHVRALLSGERVALNYLQRMSGIATAARRMSALFAGTRTRLVDTRKTCPNMRVFEKEAVRVGGAGNHRYNLSDGVLLKDNHIDAAGGVAKAVAAARAYAPFVRKIEVEVETIGQVREAVEAGADIIMLDNMDVDAMREAIRVIDGAAEVEVSGNVTMERAASLVDLGVDYVSSGAITHSAPVLDLSLKHLTVTSNQC